MMARLNSGERNLEIVKFGKARLALRVHHHHRPYHIALSLLYFPLTLQWFPIPNRLLYGLYTILWLTTRRLILQNGEPFLFFFNFILIQLYNFYTGAFKENGAVFPEHRQISR
jgi:hypothetical protein